MGKRILLDLGSTEEDTYCMTSCVTPYAHSVTQVYPPSLYSKENNFRGSYRVSRRILISYPVHLSTLIVYLENLYKTNDDTDIARSAFKNLRFVQVYFIIVWVELRN